MPTATTLPTLTSDQVRIVVDAGGREVIVLPDPIATALREHRDRGYVDHRVDGHSETFAPGTWVHATLTLIMDVYAASPIPTGLDSRSAWTAGQERYQASRRQALWPSLVGESDWNPDTRWWRNYQANKHLHVGGSVHRVQNSDSYQWRG